MTHSAEPATLRGGLGRSEHLLLVLAVVLCRVLVIHAVPIYDDAFITYRYARNLAEGAGLVFNPGAPWEPVLGTTTPLYALILAGLARAGADVIVASLALNIALDAVTAWLMPRFFERARAASVLALLAFAAFPPLVRITVGGMESPLFALCGVGAALALGARRPVLCGVLAAAACLVRPEGVLLCAVLAAALAVGPRRSKPDLVRFVVPVGVVGIVAVLVLTLVYGTPIPHSVLAKSAMRQGDPLHESFVRWKSILAQSFLPHWTLFPLLPLVAHGAWVALRRGGPLRWFSLWALSITASYLLARPHTWGWYYAVPLVAWTAWLGIGSARAVHWVASRVALLRSQPVSRFGPRALAAAIIAGAAVAGARFAAPVSERVYGPLQAWARATSEREPGARILASDIGAIGWSWKGTVLDSEGLVWPEALRLREPDNMIEAEAPEYVLLVAERPRLRHFRAREEIFGRYEAIARFSIRGETRLDPLPEDVPIEWSQDYIVYRRRD
jgi:hypothetical protein